MEWWLFEKWKKQSNNTNHESFNTITQKIKNIKTNTKITLKEAKKKWWANFKIFISIFYFWINCTVHSPFYSNNIKRRERYFIKRRRKVKRDNSDSVFFSNKPNEQWSLIKGLVSPTFSPSPPQQESWKLQDNKFPSSENSESITLSLTNSMPHMTTALQLAS